MSNLYLINVHSENKLSFSTPKFNQTLKEKDSLIKNASLGFDLPSFEEQKIPIVKKNNQVLMIPNSKNKNKNLFKDNFSLSSLFNEKNNDDNEINNNKSNQEIDNNNKIKLVNVNIEKPNLNGKKEKSLISFGDKSDNGNTSLDNNEIIYREKNNNSSSLSNKENDKENKNNKENDNNTNNISIERKTSSNLQNNNSSFQYSLPLENDMEPNVNDFFIFDDDNLKPKFNGDEAKKIQNLDNNPINIIKIDNSENDKNNIDIKNVNDIKQKKITYSKKKAKISKTERESLINNYLPKDEIFNVINEKKVLNNGYKDKKIINKNIFNSCENYKKSRIKLDICSINFSSEEKEEENNNLVLSEKRINSNNKIKSPHNKLTIIKKLNFFKIPIIKENNYVHVKNYSSRENLDKYKNNHVLDFKIEIKGRNSLNKNLKTEINLNSFYSNKKKFKNLKLDKFSGLFSDFQRHKKINSKDNFNFLNTFRETENYHKKINTNILNNNNNYNNTMIVNNNDNPKKFIVKKNNNKTINSNNKKKNVNINLNQNIKTRNFDNIIFNDSNKIFNKNFFNTINYENPEIKTIESINNNILNKYKNKEKINKKIISNKIKQKIQIKSQFINTNNSMRKIYNLKDKKNLKFENKNIKNTKLNNLQNSYYIRSNKNKNKSDIIFNKSNNNLIFSNQNKAKYNKPQKKFYNKLIYNVIETNKNKDIQKIYPTKNPKNYIINKEKIINKNQDHTINNFINNNFSSNSLTNSRYNRIKVLNYFNKHNKQYTDANFEFQDNSNNLFKIYRKPKNTCLINQFNTENIKISRKKNCIKNNINNNIREIMEYNSGNKSNKHSQIIALRKKFINGSNLTQKNSISKFYDRIQDLKSNQKNSLQRLNMNNFDSELIRSPKNDNYDNEMIRYSILRNNLNNQVINEFSITVGNKTERILENNFKNDSERKNDLNVNEKKVMGKRNETINDKKTIINVNQYYPSYFINAQNQNFKEKK